jgi:hypothetical protein
MAPHVGKLHVRPAYVSFASFVAHQRTTQPHTRVHIQPWTVAAVSVGGSLLLLAAGLEVVVTRGRALGLAAPQRGAGSGKAGGGGGGHGTSGDGSAHGAHAFSAGEQERGSAAQDQAEAQDSKPHALAMAAAGAPTASKAMPWLANLNPLLGTGHQQHAPIRYCHGGGVALTASASVAVSQAQPNAHTTHNRGGAVPVDDDSSGQQARTPVDGHGSVGGCGATVGGHPGCPAVQWSSNPLSHRGAGASALPASE